MKHIVFVIGNYFPDAGSTSVCAIKVMEYLHQKYDSTISVVCGTIREPCIEHIDNKNIYRIHHVPYTDRLALCQTRFEKAYVKMAKTIKDIVCLRDYPETDKKYSDSIYETLEKIESINHIDCIVAVYMPKQSISGSLLFKNKHPNVRIIAYFLDTLRSNKSKLVPASFHIRRIDSFENKIFSSFDKIILMKYGSNYYPEDLCKRYSDKISYLGLPSFKVLNLKPKDCYGMKCSYVGTTYSDIRNPIFAMKVFDEANKKDERVFFQIYGLSNMKEELIDWQTKHPHSFNYRGFINHEDIDYVYEESDYIVSIGNKLKGVVPGKTFEIFGTLKPIIHFTDNLNDSSLEYVQQYPNVCIISYDMSIEEAVDQLLIFFKKPYHMCNPDLVEKLFYYATPKAVSHLLYEE